MIVLEIDSVGVRYGERRVLTAASLRAPAGKVTVLIGRNGAGKTTLLRVGVGLQQPTHGVVRFHGRAYLRPRLAHLARAGLFFLPDRDILDPTIPVGLQLEAVSRHYSGPGVEALVDLCGLAGLSGAWPVSLSNGDLRRAELAIALARRPTCLVADEPLRGIDPRDVEVISRALGLVRGNGRSRGRHGPRARIAPGTGRHRGLVCRRNDPRVPHRGRRVGGCAAPAGLFRLGPPASSAGLRLGDDMFKYGLSLALASVPRRRSSFTRSRQRHRKSLAPCCSSASMARSRASSGYSSQRGLPTTSGMSPKSPR